MADISVFEKPSTKYKFFIPGTQFVGSGNARDFSGNAADAVIPTTHSDAAVWASKGYMTSVAGTGKGVYVPVAASSFDLATQSMILHGVLNKAAPAGVENPIGCGDNASLKGVYFRLNTSGKIRPIINSSGGTVTGLADSTGTLADASDHAFMLAMDGVTKNVYTFIDGVLDHTYSNAFSGGTSITAQFCIGSAAGVDPTLATSYDGKWKGVGLLVFTGGLPLNVSQLAQRHSAAPLVAISDGELRYG